jgi:hypothetical protein
MQVCMTIIIGDLIKIIVGQALAELKEFAWFFVSILESTLIDYDRLPSTITIDFIVKTCRASNLRIRALGCRYALIS